MGFKALSLSPHILSTLEAEGYATPTPIQAQAIPQILAGKDVMGVAQTGTGKTAAFALPIIQRLLEPAHKLANAGTLPTDAHNAAPAARKIRALILTPTRELAQQIEESFKTYGRGTTLRHTVVYGGVSAHWQVKALRHGVDVLVATPGRLLDLMGQGYIDLRYVQTLVLDEADQMLDMGFIHPIRQIVAKTPPRRQSLMFSATMPPEIRKLADSILKDPVTVSVSPVGSTVDKIDQSVFHVDKGGKPGLLVKYLKDNAVSRALVFTRTKHGADKLTKFLGKSGIRAAALHGNKSQGQRKRALESFVSEQPPILVATDVAARGLDIDNVTHVVNYDLPNVPESYVHRIGRTGRAGASGIAIAFCDPEERPFLRDIERLTKQKIKVVGGDPTAHETRPHGGPAGRKVEGPAAPGAPAKRHAPPQGANGQPPAHRPSSRYPVGGGAKPSHGPGRPFGSATQGDGGNNAGASGAGHRPHPTPGAFGQRRPGGFKPGGGSSGGPRKPWGMAKRGGGGGGGGGGGKPGGFRNRGR